ncbi:hypothetical protein ACFUTU_13045 [Arthrobacter sp. NPDC057388]|uniref:hypothetical protein n=1 Tax=Arthrobacter sp. NPDC057388 TaxID=3346116 RepID=UPI003627D55B
MRLTTHIRKAEDGRLSLTVSEFPELEVDARNVEEIPEVVQQAASKLTGRKEEEFDVDVRF